MRLMSTSPTTRPQAKLEKKKPGSTANDAKYTIARTALFPGFKGYQARDSVYKLSSNASNASSQTWRYSHSRQSSRVRHQTNCSFVPPKIMPLNLHSKLELWPLLQTQTHDICLGKATRMIQRLRLCWAKCAFNFQIVTPWFHVHPLACEGKCADAQGNVG